MYTLVEKLERLRDKLNDGTLKPNSLAGHVSCLINSHRDMIEVQSRKMAQDLIFLWQQAVAENEKSRRTKATAVAYARFHGACELAHAIGYGLTPSHVSAVVRDNLPYDQPPNMWLQKPVIDAVAERLSLTLK